MNPLSTTFEGSVALLEGPISDIRPSVEMPWTLNLRFEPSGNGSTEPFVRYWKELGDWLRSGATGAPPETPRGQ